MLVQNDRKKIEMSRQSFVQNIGMILEVIICPKDLQDKQELSPNKAPEKKLLLPINTCCALSLEDMTMRKKCLWLMKIIHAIPRYQIEESYRAGLYTNSTTIPSLKLWNRIINWCPFPFCN